MKTFTYAMLAPVISIFCLCTVMMDPVSSPSKEKTNEQPPIQKVSHALGGFFPFEDNSNAWWYTESGGNTVHILVTDTISDDGVVYFRVSFRENRVDTTDDWFKRSLGGIYFGQSLAGDYDLFLPVKIDSVKGSFVSGAASADYVFFDSLSVNGAMLRNVLQLNYTRPLIHGFDELTLSDSLGIVELIDHSGRWPVSYEIDSCSIGGIRRKY